MSKSNILAIADKGSSVVLNDSINALSTFVLKKESLYILLRKNLEYIFPLQVSFPPSCSIIAEFKASIFEVIIVSA